MALIDVTVGRKVYEGRSCTVNCFHVSKSGVETNIFGLLKQPAHGVNVKSKSYSRAIDHLHTDMGGYWSTLGVTVDEDSVFKMMVTMNIGPQRFTTAFYFVVRNAGAVGVLSYLRVPDQDKKTKRFAETRINILSGRVEPIELKTAEDIYGIKVNQMFRVQAVNKANYQGMLQHVELQAAESKLPHITRVSFVTTQGVERVMKRRAVVGNIRIEGRRTEAE